MELEEIHDCKECHGKIVLIEVDNVGVTHCGYCHAVVNYGPYYDNLYKDKIPELINQLRLQNLEKEATKKWQNQKKKRKRKVQHVATL